MGRVDGKIAVITGAGRGQGRSHAIRLAGEGADIVAVDICKDIDSVPYRLASPADLAETGQAVMDLGRQVLTVEADVRDVASMRSVMAQAVHRFGSIDVVIAQAGIAPLSPTGGPAAMVDTVDVNLIGVINTIHAALAHLKPGASVIATGSLAALRPGSGGSAGFGHSGYKFAKRALANYVHDLAAALAGLNIRVNAIHPTNTDTEMLHNEDMYRLFSPGSEHPTRAEAELAFPVMNAMPVPYVAAEDVSHLVVYLASDESRYVTGMQMRVDAGGYLKVRDYHV